MNDAIKQTPGPKLFRLGCCWLELDGFWFVIISCWGDCLCDWLLLIFCGFWSIASVCVPALIGVERVFMNVQRTQPACCTLPNDRNNKSYYDQNHENTIYIHNQICIISQWNWCAYLWASFCCWILCFIFGQSGTKHLTSLQCLAW